jgi:preprotein translocase subunit YajC
MLINNAFAQAAASASEQSPLVSFLPLILIFAVFYFLIIRPQSKKIKEHQKTINNLKIGNKIVTSSGIVGVIREFDPKLDEVEVEIASGVVVKMLKNHVLELVKKPEEAVMKVTKK